MDERMDSKVEFDRDEYTMSLLRFWLPKIDKKELEEARKRAYKKSIEGNMTRPKTTNHLCTYPSVSISIYPGINECCSCKSTFTHPNILLYETEQHKILRKSLEELIRIKNNE